MCPFMYYLLLLIYNYTSSTQMLSPFKNETLQLKLKYSLANTSDPLTFFS